MIDDMVKDVRYAARQLRHNTSASIGGWRGVLAFASFAAAGASMVVAIAEQMETWFLDTHAMQSLNIWGLAAAGIFGVLGWLLLAVKPAERLDAI